MKEKETNKEMIFQQLPEKYVLKDTNYSLQKLFVTHASVPINTFSPFFVSKIMSENNQQQQQFLVFH